MGHLRTDPPMVLWRSASTVRSTHGFRTTGIARHSHQRQYSWCYREFAIAPPLHIVFMVARAFGDAQNFFVN